MFNRSTQSPPVTIVLSRAAHHRSAGAPPGSRATQPSIPIPPNEDDELTVLRQNSQPSKPAGSMPGSQEKATSPGGPGDKTAPEVHDADSLQAADEDDTQLRQLLNALQEMVDRWISEHEGVPTAVVYKRVAEFMSSNYHTTRERSSTRENVLYSVERDANSEETGTVAAVRGGPPERDGGSATVPVDLTGEGPDKSVTRSKLPSLENTRSPPQSTPERLQTPIASGQQEQVRATPDSDSEGEKAKHVLKKDLAKAVRNKDDLEKSLRDIGFQSMRVPGGQVIDLCHLAKETVQTVRETHERAIKEYHQELNDHKRAEKGHEDQLKLNWQLKKVTKTQVKSGMNKWRKDHPKPGLPARIVPEGMDWQIMFNLIVYIFYSAQKEVSKIARILTDPTPEENVKAACSDLDRTPERPCEDISTFVKDIARTQAAIGGGAVDDDVVAGKEHEIKSEVIEREEQMKTVTRRFKVWMNQDLDGPLGRLYNNYDRVQTVQEYNRMLALSRDEKHRHIFELLLRKRNIDPTPRHGVGNSTLVLTYISYELFAAGKRFRENSVISHKIRSMWTVVELNRELGDGIFALLGGNNRDLLNGISGADAQSEENQQSVEETKRMKKTSVMNKAAIVMIGHVANCLIATDKAVFHGRLGNMLSDVDELIVKPALELRQLPSSPLLKSLSTEALNNLDVGDRLDYVLAHMKGGIRADGDTVSEETGEQSHKRGRSSGIEDEGAGRAKRRRYGSDSDDSVSKDDTDSDDSVSKVDTDSV